MFNGVKVFSATMVADRERLGDKISDWIQAKIAGGTGFKLKELVQTQSSDEAFHCIAITAFYFEPVK